SNSNNRFTIDFKDMVNTITFNSLGFFFLDFLIPLVAIQLETSGTVMGILFSLRTFGYLFSSSFVGFLADRYSRKKLVIIGSFGRGCSYFIMYLAIVFGSISGLALGTTILGFMAGFFWIPFDALIAEKSHKENRSQAYGLRSAALGRGNLIGGIIGFSIFGYASSYELSRYITYFALPIFGFANFYASYIFFVRVREELKILNPTIDKSINESNLNRKGISSIPFILISSSLLLLFVILLSAINASISRPFLIPYLLETLSRDPTIATLVYIPSALVSLSLAPKIGKFVDRLNIYVGVSIGSLCGAIITLLLITTNNIFVFTILLTLDTTIALTTGLLLTNMISRISQKHRGKILGFRSFFEDIGALIGPIGGGILWDLYNRQTPFLLSIGVEIMLIPIFIVAIYFLKPQLSEKYDSEDESEKVI
ncbi:MAG: MFS transporter, partial [Candidatus Hodarchaeales archaeon]